MKENHSIIAELMLLAREMGATHTAVISPDRVPVENRFAAMCLEPRCPHYGFSASCPPHVGGPQAIRDLLDATESVLVIQIEVPREILLSSENQEIFRLLHEIIAAVERKAGSLGYGLSKGFAGGSCKQLFCHDKAECRVVNQKKDCRHPKQARPSMSGHGINVSRLMKAAGLNITQAAHKKNEENGPVQDDMSSVAGIVLIGKKGNA